MIIRNNFIYLHGTAPSMRSTEYPRLSGIAGVRFTLYNNDTATYENILYENNTISLKAWEGCNLARGIWTATGPQSKDIIYRHNTVKVEAISDKIDFSDVSAVITCVDVDGSNPDLGSPLPPPVLFEDNTFIGNVNLILNGCGYGIGENTHFYRTKMEKINTFADHFAPVRLGYWYYNSRENYIIDATPGVGVNLDQAPFVNGSSGYLELYYGNTKKLLITNCRGDVLRNTNITITSTGISPIVTKTDNAGYITFEMLTVHHLKDNSAVSRTDYTPYTFAATGYSNYVIATETLKTRNGIAFEDSNCNAKTRKYVISNRNVTSRIIR